jgi:hypothetical protein
MASGDIERLAEAQREAVRALAALSEKLGSSTRLSEVERAPGPTTRLEEALGGAARAVEELSSATSANTRGLAEVGRQLGVLPAVMGGLLAGLPEKGSGVGSLLKSGLGLAGLATQIARLFRGNRREEPAAVAEFREPASLALEVGNTANILAGFPRVERGQGGEARGVEPERRAVWQPQVTVNVNAMDSRSFLDHSGDIARAVREAMLHMHPVNDLISEL